MSMLLSGLRHLPWRARRCAAALAVVFAALLMVSQAQAYRFRYAVPPGHGYVVGQHPLGLVKVIFTQCVPAGVAIGVPVHAAVLGVGLSPQVHWRADLAEGGTISFEPPSLGSVRGVHQSLAIVVPRLRRGSPVGAEFIFNLRTGRPSLIGRFETGVLIRLPCVLRPAPKPPDGPFPCPNAAQHTVAVRVPGKNVTVPAPRVDDDCVLTPEHPIVIPPGGGGGGGGSSGGGGSGGSGGSGGGGGSSGSGGSGSGGSGPAQPADEPALGVFGPLVGKLANKRPACVSAKAMNADGAVGIHAGEPATVAVTVTVDGVTMHYARVRITGPGVNQTESTGANGVPFKVRPTSAGDLVIRADACLGTDPIPVLAAPANRCGSLTQHADAPTADRLRRGPPARMAC
jgi:hypothetical protein